MLHHSEKTILHLIDTTGPGGAETVFINLLRELGRTEFRNVVVLRGDGWVADKVRSIGIAPHFIDSKGSFNLGYIKALRRLVSDENVALIHAHLLGSNVYGALLALICRKPMIATFHGAVDVADGERFLRAKFFLIGLGASKIVCVSKRLKEELSARSALPAEKVKLIYNGVDPSKFLNASLANLKQSLGLKPESILVVSVGNIRPAKGYEYLVEASLRMSESDPDIHFVVVGHQRKTLFDRLTEQISESTKKPRLHWLGFREDVADILRQADIFLLPSVSEGFSISTVEAMMAGVPVIATKSGGPEEIIVDRETGLLIPVRNPDAIVAAIKDLRKPDIRERVVARAHTVAVEKFGLETMLQEYRGLYQQLIG
ncbi:glycosyltransferase family 4 protein [Marinobacter sp. M216]|uniref:Glycosyltransferase family 4 protein n=1 Tax=Marinobacter albus TaxID=3030833 RepID=A0ABT7HCC3_9GAMM|nr:MULTISPECIES: glycosyltransferase family 4 protein [unclassified Marinobacter]MBW7470069.1 glycosyltransferase family 4 protein [Marinobacter sp. F4218]MDK9557667.1 glycosyltransferase family 4 protein [Marinobacter sp. M216]